MLTVFKGLEFTLEVYMLINNSKHRHGLFLVKILK